MQICIFVLTLVLVANSSLAQLYSDPLLLATPKRTKVLNPPYFNIATGITVFLLYVFLLELL